MSRCAGNSHLEHFIQRSLECMLLPCVQMRQLLQIDRAVQFGWWWPLMFDCGKNKIKNKSNYGRYIVWFKKKKFHWSEFNWVWLCVYGLTNHWLIVVAYPVWSISTTGNGIRQSSKIVWTVVVRIERPIRRRRRLKIVIRLHVQNRLFRPSIVNWCSGRRIWPTMIVWLRFDQVRLWMMFILCKRRFDVCISIIDRSDVLAARCAKLHQLWTVALCLWNCRLMISIIR